MKQNRTSFSMGIGTTSLLTIFVLLCLVVFAVLSLVSANADWKLADRLAQRTAAYYAACERGWQRLEQLDSQAAALYQDAAAGTPAMDAAAGGSATTDLAVESTAEAYRAALRSWLSTQEGELSEDLETGDLRFTFREEITEEQHLEITVCLSGSPASGETFCTIEAWQTKASQAWEPDTSLDLIQ